MGDIVSGAFDAGLGLATLGQSGTLGAGLGELAGGVADLGQVAAADAAAAIVGAGGKLWVTGIDLANIASLGTASFPDSSNIGTSEITPTGFGGALQRFVYDLLIPTYGFYSGANWGSTQWGNYGPYLNWGDYVAMQHDANLIDRQWVISQWTGPTTEGQIPNGPIGIANAALGTVPFWIRNGQGN